MIARMASDSTTSTLLDDSDETRDEFTLDPLACPGVFYPTLAADGVLSRIRTPGGLLTARQCRLLAAIAGTYAGGRAAITNRANIQLRALQDRLPDVVLREMQREGLASHEPTIDHLRNVMASPLAGLDPGAHLDTRPIVEAFVAHLAAHPHLAALPAKFSVGLDGGERASVAGFPNDVLLRVVQTDGAVRLRAIVRAGADEDDCIDFGLSIIEADAVPLLAALADWYVEALPADGSQPRLRQLLAERSVEDLRTLLLARVPTLVVDAPVGRVLPPVVGGAPIGVQAQRGDGFVTIGLAPRLEGWSSTQLRALAAVAEQYGSGSLRLSPWRTVSIPDVPLDAVDAIHEALAVAGLSARAPSLVDGIVACAGSAGCASGTVDTIRDAGRLALLLEGRGGEPMNVHFSGCAKCCAQRRQADVTLIGVEDHADTYDIYIRDTAAPLPGRLRFAAEPAADAIGLVERLCVEDQRAADQGDGASSTL